ncbi:MAG: L,D-transpeptidase family protein [Pontixanthobacter sp.]
MRSGDFFWDDGHVPDGPIQVWVDLRRQMVSVFRNGHEIGSAVIMYGAFDKETPLGSFDILRKVEDYHSRSYDAPMPFSLFITNDGIALHGSRMGANRATHGCVGLPIPFARKLFEATETGDDIVIVRSDPADVGGTGLPRRSG